MPAGGTPRVAKREREHASTETRHVVGCAKRPNVTHKGLLASATATRYYPSSSPYTSYHGCVRTLNAISLEAFTAEKGSFFRNRFGRKGGTRRKPVCGIEGSIRQGILRQGRGLCHVLVFLSLSLNVGRSERIRRGSKFRTCRTNCACWMETPGKNPRSIVSRY
jgi:hypothetical protein